MKTFLKALVIVGVLFFASCSDESSDVTSNSLEVSQQKLEFAKAPETKTVKVTTDAEKWNAIGSADWIITKVAEGKLDVEVLENTTTATRKGRILIVAGNNNQSIEVTQAGTEVSATVTPEELKLDSFGGTIEVDVVANAQNWEVSTPVKWLTLKANPQKGVLKVDYVKNEDRNSRTATITVKIGTYEKLINVTQEGLMVYLLPYLDFKNASVEGLKKFETARKSVEVKGPTSSSTSWVFKTRSLMFSQIKYYFSSDYEMYKDAEMIPASSEIFQKELPGFKEFLKKNGFVEKASDEASCLFVSKEKFAKIRMFTTAGREKINVFYQTFQTEDYATFTKFPYGFITWGATVADVEKYEKSAGHKSAVSDEHSKPAQGVYAYDVDEKVEGAEAPFLRTYLINKNTGLYQSGQIIRNGSLAFYKDRNRFYPTKEFLQLLEKEGFEYYRGPDSSGTYIYLHAEKELGLFVRPMAPTDVKEYWVGITFIHYKKPEGSANSASLLKVENIFK